MGMGGNPILIQYGISFSLNCYRCDDIIMTQLIEVDQIEPIINYPRQHSHTNKRVFRITCTRISLGGGGDYIIFRLHSHCILDSFPYPTVWDPLLIRYFRSVGPKGGPFAHKILPVSGT